VKDREVVSLLAWFAARPPPQAAGRGANTAMVAAPVMH
jgi:hypothetical protein